MIFFCSRPTEQVFRKGQKSHCCLYCNELFQKSSELRNYYKVHNNGYRYFAQFVKRDINKREHSSSTLVPHWSFSKQLQQCDKTYCSFVLLKEDTEIHRKLGPFECTSRNKKLACEKYLKTHPHLHGKEKQVVNFAGRDFLCLWSFRFIVWTIKIIIKLMYVESVVSVKNMCLIYLKFGENTM